VVVDTIIVPVRVLIEMGNKPVSRDYQTVPNNATRNWDISRILAPARGREIDARHQAQ
jgi:hypothetical protein